MRTSRARSGIVGTLAVALALAACAPTVDGPTAEQRASDREDGDRLAAQLATLPGALHATVTLHRPARDPLALAPPTPATAGVLIVVDDAADRAQVTASALALVHAAAPEVAHPALLVEVGAHRPALAQVGPFTVAASSRTALRAALALALAVIAALAGWIAVRYRRGNSAQ